MRIAVIGATGRTGMRVVEQALARGHHVTALARHPEALVSSGADIVTADVRDQALLVERLGGTDAVVSTLGVGTSREPTTLYSHGTSSILQAMRVHGIGRLAVVCASPVGPRDEQPLLERRVLMPILDRVFGATYQDMARMESLLRASDVDWISLRPPRLVDKPARGYRIDDRRPPPRSRTLTFADLAAALLDWVELGAVGRRAAYVAN